MTDETHTRLSMLAAWLVALAGIVAFEAGYWWTLWYQPMLPHR